MNLSQPFVRRPIGTVLLTAGIALAGIGAFFVLPVSPLPQVDYPDHLGERAAAGREPRHDGDERGDAARAPPRHDRRRHRDDVEQPGRQRAHQPAVRALARHRRRGARGAGGDQRVARRPAGDAAQQPDLSQGEPVGRAGDHPRADVGDDDAGRDLRHRLEPRQPAAGAGRRRRRRRDRRLDAAGGARRAAAVRAQQVRHQRRGRPRRDPGEQRQPAEGTGRERRAAPADLHPDAGAARGRLRADGRRLAQRLGGAARRRRRGQRRRREHAHARPLQRQAGGDRARSRASRAPTSSRPSTACARCCPSCARSCRRRSRSTSPPTAPTRSAPRCARSRSRC